MPTETTIHRLDNGIRLAAVRMPHMQSVSLGLWTDAGSRHESPQEHGMAHFLEHMLFKGTPTRTAVQISREIEGLGSSIDGFTVEDHTGYQAKAPSDQFEKLFSVLADFYQHPTLDPADLESERQVIHEEISMVRDQPAQLLEDLLSEAAWGETHPLGRSITGTDESLDEIRRGDVLDFFQRAYSGKNTVVSVAGNIDPDSILEIVAREFSEISPGAPLHYESAPQPRVDHRFEEALEQEQAHVALSLRGVARHDPRRYALKLLDVILGENMSSRLFQELREERALCYEVQSDLVSFADGGLIQIYVALSPENLEEALFAISKVAKELVNDGVTAEELEDAKSFVIGQSRISLENTASQMMWAGESLLFFDDWLDPEEIHRRIEAVTLEEVHHEAMRLFSPFRVSSALVGPVESNHIVENWRQSVC
ncbi:MAG: pitrilysin family protein [Verrucomicrobiales bacterium]|nr:pitrilysin family protein [Verrucomicrobiales bacterium]